MQMDDENASSAALTVALDDYALLHTLSLLLFACTNFSVFEILGIGVTNFSVFFFKLVLFN